MIFGVATASARESLCVQSVPLKGSVVLTAVAWVIMTDRPWREYPLICLVHSVSRLGRSRLRGRDRCTFVLGQLTGVAVGGDPLSFNMPCCYSNRSIKENGTFLSPGNGGTSGASGQPPRDRRAGCAN